MTKESEGIDGATRSSQDLAGKVSKTCMYVRRGLRENGSKSSKHDSIMSRRQDDVQVMDEETATGL